MRAVEQATPEILDTVKRVGSNIEATTKASTEASQATAQVMKNFAEATKPLPKWLRVFLAVAPPSVQIAYTMAIGAAK
jgi:hypothetical protein